MFGRIEVSTYVVNASYLRYEDPRWVLTGLCRCHEFPGHDIAYLTVTEFARFGLKLTTSDCSCAAKILVLLGCKQSPLSH